MEGHLSAAYATVDGIGGEVAFLNGVFAYMSENHSAFMRSRLALPTITKSARKFADEAEANFKKQQEAKVEKPVEPVYVAEEVDERAEDVSSEPDAADEKKPAPIGNGGSTDRYIWTQTLQEVNIMLPIPSTATGKMIDCQITPTHLKVGVKGSPLILNGEFPQRVSTEDSTWTIETERNGNKTLTVYLPKSDRMNWWDCVVKGEPTIDTKTIVPENSQLSDLDGETRQTVEKMMFDQRQKAMGKPTSEESKKAEMFAKFQAQHPEMDFSQVKFQ